MSVKYPEGYWLSKGRTLKDTRTEQRTRSNKRERKKLIYPRIVWQFSDSLYVIVKQLPTPMLIRQRDDLLFFLKSRAFHNRKQPETQKLCTFAVLCMAELRDRKQTTKIKDQNYILKAWDGRFSVKVTTIEHHKRLFENVTKNLYRQDL